jgi:hypothetical protein
MAMTADKAIKTIEKLLNHYKEKMPENFERVEKALKVFKDYVHDKENRKASIEDDPVKKIKDLDEKKKKGDLLASEYFVKLKDVISKSLPKDKAKEFFLKADRIIENAEVKAKIVFMNGIKKIKEDAKKDIKIDVRDSTEEAFLKIVDDVYGIGMWKKDVPPIVKDVLIKSEKIYDKASEDIKKFIESNEGKKITAKLDKIASEIEPQDIVIVMAIDKISDLIDAGFLTESSDPIQNIKQTWNMLKNQIKDDKLIEKFREKIELPLKRWINQYDISELANYFQKATDNNIGINPQGDLIYLKR